MTDLAPQNANARERLIIAAVCLVAGLRIFLFSAAFPFFNNVDEQAHFDLVLKYSKGHLPGKPLEKYGPEAAKIIADNCTTEYFYDFLEIPGPDEKKQIAADFENHNNRETWSWPSYYLFAGLWCQLGISLGITGGRLLYWIRFLNIPLIAALVWISYIIGAGCFRENRQFRIALPVLVALFPQDTFYSITSDALSPLVFTASFLMLMRIYSGDKSCRYHLFAGLAIAVTFLTKISNIAIIPLAAIVILVKIKQNASSGRLKEYVPSMLAFCLAAIIPVTFWLTRNRILFGDAIGSAAVFNERGWHVKPLSEIFNHPIFTGRGLFTFLTELTQTFWRGEFIWRTRRLSYPSMDLFYVLSSAVFLIAAVLFFVSKRNNLDKPFRFALPSSLLVIVISVLFLAFTSTRIEFGDFAYPSDEHPYFTSGRLMAGTIVPFLLLYIAGLHYILSKLRLASRLLIIVIIIAAVITISEIALTWPVFASPYNWFHLK